MISAGHWPYLIILLVIVLIIWGPGKLPDLGSALGKGIREFRKATNEVKDSVINTTATEPTPAPAPAAQPPAATPPAPPVGTTPTEHPSA